MADFALQRVTAGGLALLLTLLTLGACGRTESLAPLTHCRRQMRGAPALPLRTSGKVTIAWSTDACIPLSFSTQLTLQQQRLAQAALEAWSSPECTGLCFAAPWFTDATPSARDDHRLHVAFQAGSNNEWVLEHDPVTGEVLHGTIWLSAQSTVGDVLKQVGLLLAFLPEPTHGESVLSSTASHSSATNLGAADAQSVCAAYPACAN